MGGARRDYSETSIVTDFIPPPGAPPQRPGWRVVPYVPPPPPLPYFGPARAALLFLIYLGTQLFVSAGVAMAGAFWWMANRGLSFTKAGNLDAAINATMGPTIIATVLVSGIVTIIVGRVWTAHLRGASGAEGIGWRRPTAKQLIIASIIGAACGALWIAVVAVLPPKDPTTSLGPMAKMVKDPLTHFGWTLVAVLLAPPVEEILFRGMFLAGFVRRWGLGAGSAMTTALFVMLHLPETIHYPLATLAITMLALVLLAVRLQTDSIFSAIALHATYNLVVAWATWG